MVYLLDRYNRTVGYLDGDDCKDLDHKILGQIVGNQIQGDGTPLAYVSGNEITAKVDGRTYGYIIGNELQDLNGDIIGSVKVNDIQDTKDVSRAAAVLFWFFDLRTDEEKEQSRRSMERMEREKEERKKAQEAVKKEKEAADKLRELAEQGDANAQYELGLAHLNGKYFLPTAKFVAEDLIRKAAAQGHEQAKDYFAREEEKKEREAKEAAEKRDRESEARAEFLKQETERRKKQFFRTLGRVFAALLAIFSTVAGFLVDEPKFILLSISFIISFLFVFFSIGRIKKVVFLSVGLLLIVIIFEAAVEAFMALSKYELSFILAMGIGSILSYTLAMIYPEEDPDLRNTIVRGIIGGIVCALFGGFLGLILWTFTGGVDFMLFTIISSIIGVIVGIVTSQLTGDESYAGDGARSGALIGAVTFAIAFAIFGGVSGTSIVVGIFGGAAAGAISGAITGAFSGGVFSNYN